MARFNKPTSGNTKTKNYENEDAYKLPKELELYSLVATSIMHNKFYTSADKELIRMRKLVNSCDPEFVAKLAIYARSKMNLRSAPIALAVELAMANRKKDLKGLIHKCIAGVEAVGSDGKRLYKNGRPVFAVNGVIQRADEITEILAYYQSTFRSDKKERQLRKVPHGILTGIRRVFESGRFDEYNYAKYDRETEVELRDALFISHPKARDEAMDKLFKKIIDKTMDTPYTWETQISAIKKEDTEAVKKAWENLIFSNKMGIFATIRNLRNILNANVSDEAIDKLCAYITTPEVIHKSRMFPFRFLAAFNEIEENTNLNTRKVVNALNTAMTISVDNIVGFDSKTKVCVAIDTSGSMNSRLSDKSKMAYQDVGLTLGNLMASRFEKVLVGIFGDTWKVKNLPTNDILHNVATFRKMNDEVGSSTNGWTAVKYLLDKKIIVDKLMMFTDCQLWDSTSWYGDKSQNVKTLWNEYLTTVNDKAEFYLFDLAGYGNTPLSVLAPNVFFISGWSEKVFELLDAIKNGKSAVDVIKAIDLSARKPVAELPTEETVEEEEV